MNFLRILRTVQHLRPRQIVGQIRHRLRKWIENPDAFAQRASPPFPGIHWQVTEDFFPSSPKRHQPELINAGEFTFLNRAESLSQPVNWQRNDLPKLWLYNLHYFEYLWDLDFESAKKIATNWIDTHLLTRGAVGWEPYPICLRTMNWCCIFFHRYREQVESDITFRDKLWKSIHLQIEWLLKHLETHLLGNHYLENACALIVAGTCFSESHWRSIGRSILDEQLAEQILPDGGHFERSPMYQARIVYLLKLLWNIGVMDVLSSLKPAEAWLDAMTHPDGKIALFNDAAFAIYPDSRRETGARQRIINLPETGYFGAETSAGHYLICDAAPIGPDYLPGHAHADIFTFELSLFGTRVIVDSGTFDYQISDSRALCRSTKAHNTVEIDGQDQSEMWGAFRVARRGRPTKVKFEKLADGFRLSGSHDGYRRLLGFPTHNRSFRFFDKGVLAITDVVDSSVSHRAVSRLHLHPDVEVVTVASDAVHVKFAGGEAMIAFIGKGNIRLEDTFYFPEFGMQEKNLTIAFDWKAGGGSESGILVVAGANM